MEETCYSNFTSARKSGVKSKLNKTTSGEGNGRMKGLTIVKPVIIGNVAWHLGGKNQDGHTHQWTVYLRSYDNEDMSVYVKRVHFILHKSYAQPNRVITCPPYTVTETGWGEFDIAIKIYFQDSSERSVTIYHFLKLYEREEDGSIKFVPRPVTSEFYDELVFKDPTVKIHTLLSQPRSSRIAVAAHNQNYELKKVQDLNKILEAKQKVRQEIEELKKKLADTKEEIHEMKKKLGQQ